jgi:putative transposase
LLEQLKAAGRSQRSALALIGLSRGSWHYRNKPRARVAEPIAHADRVQPHALTEAESAQVAQAVNASLAKGRSVRHAWYEHIDSGPVLASQTTFQRVAAKVRTTSVQRRRRRSTATRDSPTLQAARPDQVLCWDISFLPGRTTRQSFALYSVIDLYSRKIVGWTIQTREDRYIAAELLTAVVDAAEGKVEIVHSDNGSAMTSNHVRDKLDKQNVTCSYIRPGVSNDNAYIESWFATVKSAHAYPRAFRDIDHATEWMTEWVEYYNHHHHHGGLAGYTPASVHDGTWVVTARGRQTKLDEHFRQHAGRYRKRPQIPTPKAIVTINLENDGSRLTIPPIAATLIAA